MPLNPEIEGLFKLIGSKTPYPQLKASALVSSRKLSAGVDASMFKVEVRVSQKQSDPFHLSLPSSVWPVAVVDNVQFVTELEKRRELRASLAKAFKEKSIVGFLLHGEWVLPHHLVGDTESDATLPKPTENGFWAIGDQLVPVMSSNDDAPWVALTHILPKILHLEEYEEISQYVMTNPPPRNDRKKLIYWLQTIGQQLLDESWIMGWKGNLYYSEGNLDALADVRDELLKVWPVESNITVYRKGMKEKTASLASLASDDDDEMRTMIKILSSASSRNAKELALAQKGATKHSTAAAK